MNVKELKRLLENTPDELEVFSMTPLNDECRDADDDPTVELLEVEYAGVLEDEDSEPFFALIAPGCISKEDMDENESTEE